MLLSVKEKIQDCKIASLPGEQMDVNKYISTLDTNRYGFKVAKIDEFESNIETQLERLRDREVRLVISRIKSNNIKLLNHLEDLNFRIKDTQLTVSRNLVNIEGLMDNSAEKRNILIREVHEDEIHEVGEIAYNAFKDYGHYAADSRLDRDESNDIYRDWARRSCVDKSVADHMFVAKVGNDVSGFLSLKVIKENERRVGIQHLGAVGNRYRNCGVFRLLILKCLVTGNEKNHDVHITYLLSTNIPVIRAYLRMGFTVSDSNHTLHCWL